MRTNDRRKSKASAKKAVALPIQFSYKNDKGVWVNERMGVAFESEDGSKLFLKLNTIPTHNLNDGIIKLWLTPYDEGK